MGFWNSTELKLLTPTLLYMKILLVLNKPNREIPIMESIKREILAINQDAVIEIKEMCAPGV